MSSDVNEAESEALSFRVTDEMAGQRLDASLAQLSGLPRSQIQRWIEEGRVRVDGDEVRRGKKTLSGGEWIEAEPPEIVEARVEAEEIALSVLYEDSDLIVIDKAAGMVVHPAPGHPSGTLVNALLHHCEDLAGVGGVLRPGIVHRLDRGTSGVMVAAKNDLAHAALSGQFQNHSIERIYLAFVRGVPRADQGRVEQPIGRHPRDRKRMSIKSRVGRAAATRFRVLERFVKGGQAWLEIRPETGRTHQIRVHLASIGLPIFGDTVYGRERAKHARGVTRLDRPALHAAVLGFEHPRSGETMRFEAPLPDDLQTLLGELRALEQ
jgi:23S rRNA pseudouridine1911/1915/1917 synthase